MKCRQATGVATALIALVAAGCGRPPDEAPSAAPTSETVPAAVTPAPHAAQPALSIPDRLSGGDRRSPVQRLVGVPADDVAAEIWAHDLTQAGIVECMARLGYEYEPVQYGATTDPNTARAEKRPSEEASQYSNALLGPDPTSQRGGCELESSDRVFAANRLSQAWGLLEAGIIEDSAVLAATVKTTQCLADAGYSPADAPFDMQQSCHESSGLNDALYQSREQLETAFIREHESYFLDFVANMPRIAS